MERVATYNHQNTLVQYMMKAEAKVAAEQVRSASGLNSTDYKGIATDSGRLVNLESHYRRLERYIDEGEVVNGRIQSMYDAVGGMADLTSRLSALVVGLQGNNAAGVEGVVAEAAELMKEFAGLLNTRQEGRYLFAGGRTDQPAVTIDGAAYPAATTVPSSADTRYYQGDSTVAHFQAADDLILSYGVTANEPGFEKALRAFNLLANLATNPVDTAVLDEVTRLASDSTDALAVTQARLGAASASLERTIDRHVDEQLVLQSHVDDIRSVDLAESTTRLSQLQASLEATMSLMKILEENNLSKYL
ncbi:flagellar hook-associated protein 3 FlgL [Azospirillum agricola]|uniref:flagellin N-terminal helical domain-containing protein n=1 Tax=Azospirillum agricola TaxID=1720247 RepID=UPI001AE9A0F2|nr:flagellin [Azospirillum agricola]MBP2230932.1 flagellar hook-associated protein 3 FlgL [Azospirillum agricola]